MNQLQLIQNSAAQVLTKTRRREHIMPILGFTLVSFHNEFKIIVLAYKALALHQTTSHKSF